MSSGALAFARFAWPPNVLGYCGPAGTALFEALATESVEAAAGAARRFEGAWPYLEVIAASAGIDDPLDRRVVEAYWIGNELLRRVDPARLGTDLDERFRRRSGPGWERVASTIGEGAVAHHAFHVFVVYPWTGMLRAGPAEPALEVLERCSIRAGTVATVDGDRALVSVQSLAWDGVRFDEGDAVDGWYKLGAEGIRTTEPRVGERVAVHWDWVCDRLDRVRERRLAGWTAHARRLAERGLQGIPFTAAAQTVRP
ncbi:MAG TPA: DUF6390 family protein [Acidimicrobiia bacterium]|jgi:hypothetical protein